RWRDLLFVHWPLPTEALRVCVPASLEIDTFDGTAYVGIVAFAMASLAVAGIPEILSLSFLETNVRTYVHVEGRDPGVYFLSLDADSLFAVLGARASSGLPYYHAHARSSRDGRIVAFATERHGPIGRRPFLRS